MDEASSPQQQLTEIRATQAHWRAVTELFDQCLGASAEEQEQLLANAESSLAIEVRSLLENAGTAEESLASPAEQLLSLQPHLPRHIGAYRIERLLGQGGMGSVFLARRVGEFDQLVAVKLIRRDFGSAAQALEKRFRQERQILASLQHPYIAHLIDGGTSGHQPYLVVEYVPGLRIDEHCNANRLSLRQRIELHLKVCAAVQYAHQNLIVHRDLKPANVLVQEDGTPKLLDFGVAKLLHEDMGHPDMTRTAMRIFTPGYASPEQLRGEPVGTASDVYSLGVMLYELLTGQRPHLVETDSDFAMLQAICNQAPMAASVNIKRYPEEERVAKAAQRSATYASWERSLRNDLDLILSTAIAADVTRRYASVEQFSADLNRYLGNQPILARKDTWTYRTAKFWSRHKSLVSVASLSLLLLLAAGVGLWREDRIAVQQRQMAERRFNDLRALARSNITEVQDALERVPGGTEARALILRRAVQYLDGLSAEKDNDIDLQRDLAAAYLLVAQRLGNPASSNLGDFVTASADYDRSIRIRESILTMPKANEKDRFMLIYARYHKALMQNSAGQLEASKETLTQASSAADAILANNPHDVTEALNFVSLTHRKLSNVLLENGGGPGLGAPLQALVHAELSLRSIEAAYNRQPNNPHILANLISAKSSEADLLFASGRQDEGLRLQKSAVEFGKSLGSKMTGEAYLILLHTNYEYGLELAAKDPRKGLPWMASSLATVVKARASDPADMKLARWCAIGTTMVGNVQRRAGERQKGLRMMTEGMAQLTSLLAKNSRPTGELRYPLAAGYRGLGDDALDHKKPRQALSEYQKAERVYAEDAAEIPEDLEVYTNRSDNMIRIAALQARLSSAKEASASRRLALEYADRVLSIHPDNQVVQALKASATQLKQ